LNKKNRKKDLNVQNFHVISHLFQQLNFQQALNYKYLGKILKNRKKNFHQVFHRLPISSRLESRWIIFFPKKSEKGFILSDSQIYSVRYSPDELGRSPYPYHRLICKSDNRTLSVFGTFLVPTFIRLTNSGKIWQKTCRFLDKKLSKFWFLIRFFDQNFAKFPFWTKFPFSVKISIFDQNFHFWPKLPILTKIMIVEQSF